MSDPIALPPPESPAEPPPPPPEPPRRKPLLPWLTGAGFLVLVAALLWVWQHPAVPPPSTEATEALARQLAALESRVARLEQRPPPQVPDLAPLAVRIAALEQRPPAQGAAPVPADLAPLAGRVAALEQRQPPNLAPLEARIATLQATGREIQAEMTRRLDTEAARLAASEQRA